MEYWTDKEKANLNSLMLFQAFAKIKTSLDLDTRQFINDHSNKKLKMFIYGDVDSKVKRFAENLLKRRKDMGLDDSVCKYQ